MREAVILFCSPPARRGFPSHRLVAVKDKHADEPDTYVLESSDTDALGAEKWDACTRFAESARHDGQKAETRQVLDAFYALHKRASKVVAILEGPHYQTLFDSEAPSFEKIAADAAASLRRALCLPSLKPDGQSEAGH
jgi:acetylornithine/succinyldiaminopimelate/putrescine aminotransferase